MKLTNAYIIDGDVIEKRLKAVQKVIDNATTGSWRSECVIEKNLLMELQQHLKPALPIVEEAFEAGQVREGQLAVCIYLLKSTSTVTALSKQDFLTKDF